MTKTVPAVKARQQFGSLLNEVDLKGTNIVIERDGKAKAVMISVGQFEAMERRRKQAFDSIEKISKEAQAVWEADGITAEEMDEMILDEVQTVRAERYAKGKQDF